VRTEERSDLNVKTRSQVAPTEQTDFALDGLEKLDGLDENQLLIPETTAADETIHTESRQYRIERK
jgi:hypothetical protein